MVERAEAGPFLRMRNERERELFRWWWSLVEGRDLHKQQQQVTTHRLVIPPFAPFPVFKGHVLDSPDSRNYWEDLSDIGLPCLKDNTADECVHRWTKDRVSATIAPQHDAALSKDAKEVQHGARTLHTYNMQLE